MLNECKSVNIYDRAKPRPGKHEVTLTKVILSFTVYCQQSECVKIYSQPDFILKHGMNWVCRFLC